MSPARNSKGPQALCLLKQYIREQPRKMEGMLIKVNARQEIERKRANRKKRRKEEKEGDFGLKAPK